MHKIKAIILSFFIIILTPTCVLANEEAIDALMKIAKRGDYAERLDALKQLEAFGVEAQGEKKALTKLFKNIKQPKLAVQLLSTLIALEADDSRVYKTYNNYFKYKANKLDKKKKAESFLREIGNINYISPALIEFLKSYRDDEKRDQILLYEVLTSLMVRDQKYIDQIVAEISDKPEESIRTLTKLDHGVSQYFPQVLNELKNEPIAVMDFFRKHSDLRNPRLIEYAINKSKDMPATSRLGLSITYLGPYHYFHDWQDALQALSEMSRFNDDARNALLEILETDWWYIVLEIVSRSDDIDLLLVSRIKEYIFEKLPMIVQKDIELSTTKYNIRTYNILFAPYVFNGYRVCYALSRFGINDKEELQLVKNAITTSPNELTKGGCTLPFMNAETDKIDKIQFLEQYLDMDWEKELDDAKSFMGRAKLPNNFRYNIIQLREKSNVNVVPYYAAASILSLDLNHEEAKSVIYKYIDSGIPMMDNVYHRFLKKPAYQSYYYDNIGYFAYQVEFSPIEIIGNLYETGGEEWNTIILEELSSDQMYRNLNAAKLLMAKNAEITKEMKIKLIEKARENLLDPKISIYVELLKNSYPEDKEVRELSYVRFSHYWNLLYRQIM